MASPWLGLQAAGARAPAARYASVSLLSTASRVAAALDPEARQWLADKGYDPAYGARPLKRVVQKALQDPLARMLLAGEVKDGETIPVTAGEEGLIIGNQVVAPTAKRPKPSSRSVT